MGSVAMWKYEEQKLKNNDYSRDPEKDWKLQSPSILSGAVKRVYKHVFFIHIVLFN